MAGELKTKITLAFEKGALSLSASYNKTSDVVDDPITDSVAHVTEAETNPIINGMPVTGYVYFENLSTTKIFIGKDSSDPLYTIYPGKSMIAHANQWGSIYISCEDETSDPKLRYVLFSSDS